jgi:hypothetical protein
VESSNLFGRFEDEITRLLDGRYCTRLPRTTDQWRLQRNFHLTTGRLKSTLATLRKTPRDIADYSYEIQQLIEKQLCRKQTWNSTVITLMYHIIQSTEETSSRKKSFQFLTEQKSPNMEQA